MKTAFDPNKLLEDIQNLVTQLRSTLQQKGVLNATEVLMEKYAVRILIDSKKLLTAVPKESASTLRKRRIMMAEGLRKTFKAIDASIFLETGEYQKEINMLRKKKSVYYREMLDLWKKQCSPEVRAHQYNIWGISAEELEEQVAFLELYDEQIKTGKKDVRLIWKKVSANKRILENMLKGV